MEDEVENVQMVSLQRKSNVPYMKGSCMTEQHNEVSKVLMLHGNYDTFLPRKKRAPKEESECFQDCSIKNMSQSTIIKFNFIH